MIKMFNSPYKVINTRKYNTWCKYQTRIDTYGRGCAHNCLYCYAKALLEFRGNWDKESPATSYITQIEESVSRLDKDTIVRLGSMTDCFQPSESIKKVTYQTIKILNQYKIGYLIVTKSCLVSDRLYVDIYDQELAHFQISISSTGDSPVWYENTDSPNSRIKSIEKLYALGFDVSVRLSPFLYQYTDIDTINKIKCNKILIEFLKVNTWVKKSFDIDYSDYSLCYGGHKNLQLNKKIDLVNKIVGFEQVSVGEYVREHHEYFKNNKNHNTNDCCNLNITPSKKNCKQTEIDFEKETF